jgi:hypothetical protein
VGVRSHEALLQDVGTLWVSRIVNDTGFLYTKLRAVRFGIEGGVGSEHSGGRGREN